MTYKTLFMENMYQLAERRHLEELDRMAGVNEEESLEEMIMRGQKAEARDDYDEASDN